jgi:hypothetical protein
MKLVRATVGYFNIGDLKGSPEEHLHTAELEKMVKEIKLLNSQPHLAAAEVNRTVTLIRKEVREIQQDSVKYKIRRAMARVTEDESVSDVESHEHTRLQLENTIAETGILLNGAEVDLIWAQAAGSGILCSEIEGLLFPKPPHADRAKEKLQKKMLAGLRGHLAPSTDFLQTSMHGFAVARSYLRLRTPNSCCMGLRRMPKNCAPSRGYQKFLPSAWRLFCSRVSTRRF